MPRKKRVKRARRLKPLPKLPSRHRDADKQTVAAVLVVAILVSLLGTWFVLDSITSVNYTTSSTQETGSPIDSGKLSIAVGNVPRAELGSSGKIALEIT